MFCLYTDFDVDDDGDRSGSGDDDDKKILCNLIMYMYK